MSSWQPPSGPGQGQSPYGPPPASSFYGPPQQPQRSPSWIIALGLGGVAVVLLLCCGMGAGVIWLGMGVMEEEIVVALRDNPKLREHIGEIESLDVDFAASAAADDEELYVYHVKGSKGSGRLTVRQTTDEEWNEVVEEATLRLPDGTEIELLP